MASGPPVSSPEPPAELTRSGRCSYGAIIDWDGSAGPATGVDAIDEMVASLKAELEGLPADGWDEFENPYRLAAAIRGLESVRAIMVTDGLLGGEVTAFTGTGQELARVTIERAGADVSGYRVGMISAAGWTSDDPFCE